MFKKICFAMVMLVMMFSFVSAKPPVTTEFVGDTRYVIEANIMDYYKPDTSACVQIYVFNQTDGTIADNTKISCKARVINTNGTIILVGYPIAHEDHFDMCRNDTILTERGDYGLMILCNDSSQYGTKTTFFGVNNYGEGLTEAIEGSHNNAMWFLMILFGLSLYGLFSIEQPTGKLACYFSAHLIFIIGTFAEWQFLQGYALSPIANEGIFKILFYVSITAFFPMILLAIAWIVYIHLVTDEIADMMDRGMSSEEAWGRSSSKAKGWFRW